MSNMLRLIRLGLRKIDSSQGDHRCNRKDPLLREIEEGLQLVRISRGAAESMEAVLLSPDTLSVIFKHLGHSDGLVPAELATYARVCKTWRQASLEIPLQVRFRAPLRPRHRQKLLTTEQRIGSMTFCESDTAVATILQDPAFCSRQASSLQFLWDVDCIDSNGLSLNFSAYPALRKLFIQHGQKMGESTSSFFDSRIISQLGSLEILSLRGYACMDLRFLPLSLKMLQVGPGTLVRGMKEEAVPGSWDESLASGTSPQGSATDIDGCTAFPLGLKLQQVVINCGRGAFLDEPLKHYFAVAEQLTLFGQRLVIKDAPQDPYAGLLASLEQSPVQALYLDFDGAMFCRMGFGLHPRLSRSGVTAGELCAGLQAAVGCASYTFSRQRGSLHEQSVVARRTC